MLSFESAQKWQLLLLIAYLFFFYSQPSYCPSERQWGRNRYVDKSRHIPQNVVIGWMWKVRVSQGTKQKGGNVGLILQGGGVRIGRKAEDETNFE